MPGITSDIRHHERHHHPKSHTSTHQTQDAQVHKQWSLVIAGGHVLTVHI